MDNLKLRVKASDYEIEAEGSRDFVQQQYEAFRQLLENMTQKSNLSKSLGTPPPEEKTDTPRNSKNESFQKLLVWDALAQRVKVTIIPDGPRRIADMVLLLLLGYRELRGLGQVSALDLNQGLGSAGFNQFRLDRIMAPYLKAKLMLRSGVGKGSRYRLTTRGVKRAQELAQSLAALLPDSLP